MNVTRTYYIVTFHRKITTKHQSPSQYLSKEYKRICYISISFLVLRFSHTSFHSVWGNRDIFVLILFERSFLFRWSALVWSDLIWSYLLRIFVGETIVSWISIELHFSSLRKRFPISHPYTHQKFKYVDNIIVNKQNYILTCKKIIIIN